MLHNCSIAKVFFEEPTKAHYLIEISKKAKLAHTSVFRELINMEKNNFLKVEIEKRGKRKFPLYLANFQSNLFRKAKRLYNLNALYDSGLIEFLKENLSPSCIILFGSYSRGEDLEESDIDLFIESKFCDLNLKSFEKKLKRKIELHIFESFRKISGNLQDSIINGIILDGYLEVFSNENPNTKRSSKSKVIDRDGSS